MNKFKEANLSSILTQTKESKVLGMPLIKSFAANCWQCLSLPLMLFSFLGGPTALQANTKSAECKFITTLLWETNTPVPYENDELIEDEFGNYYLQVICSRSRDNAMDEFNYYGNFVETHFCEDDDDFPYKVVIGPFKTRADARIYKRNNPDFIPDDAFPCPPHTVEPMIVQSKIRN